MNAIKWFGTLAMTACIASAQVSRDEWYDPTDWFDGNDYEYDDTLGLDYNDNTGFYEWEEDTYFDDVYGDSLDYDYDLPNSSYGEGTEYGWHRQYYPRQNRWGADYGWNYNGYDYTPEADDRWNARQRQQARNQGQNRQESASNQNRSDQQADSRNANNQRNNVRTIRGTISEIRQMALRDRQGARNTHSVTRVRMQDGRSVLVDFGPVRRNENFRPNQGDQLEVQGQIGRINGRRVLFAERARLDGRSFQVNRQNNRNQQSSQSRQASFAGRLQNYSRTYMNDESGESRQLVRITLDNGRSFLTDVGHQTQVSEWNLDEGDWVAVRGQRERVNGRNVVRATEITIDGQPRSLERTSQGTQGQQGSQTGHFERQNEPASEER